MRRYGEVGRRPSEAATVRLMKRLVHLSDILIGAKTYSGSDSLFLPMNEKWGLSTAGLLVTEDEDSEEIEHAGLIYEYAVGLETVQDIIANAEQQYAEPTPAQLLIAFCYYYDHDAYVDLKAASNRE
jgi:hypothetical protein